MFFHHHSINIVLGAFAILMCAIPTFPQHALDLNFGLSASKSVLGLSYRRDDHDFNLGIRGFSYSNQDGLHLQPGFAYNRYFTNNGFYASAIYVPEFRSKDVWEYTFNSSADPLERRVTEEKGWHPGYLLMGLGKSFQFTRWGLHADLGAATRADADFGRVWGLYIGAAASYRFNLD
jgi:hypothetical protein